MKEVFDARKQGSKVGQTGKDWLIEQGAVILISQSGRHRFNSINFEIQTHQIRNFRKDFIHHNSTPHIQIAHV